jgi:hypothetical protein
MGLAASLARPGGNVTGLTTMDFGINGKRIEILKEAVPGLKEVVLLVSPSNLTYKRDTPWARDVEVAARGLGVHRSRPQHQNRTGIYRFPFARGFASSRACSMNSRATGLSVRFFRVTIPLGTRGSGSSIGNTLISGRLAGICNADAGKIERKRPGRQKAHAHFGANVTTAARA